MPTILSQDLEQPIKHITKRHTTGLVEVGSPTNTNQSQNCQKFQNLRLNPENFNLTSELNEERYLDWPDAKHNFEGRRFIFETDLNPLSNPTSNNSTIQTSITPANCNGTPT